jgi:hypothetical protein
MKQETTGKQFAESADKVITVTRKQTAVKTIFEKFNLMSDADFKSWMLNNHDELERMEKEQTTYDFLHGYKHGNEPMNHDVIDKWYDKTYGGDK